MQAKDIMTRRVITVSPDDTMQQLARVLTEGGISGAPVVGDSGEMIGIVSEADVISKRGARVGDVMHRKVISVTEDTSAEEVCCLMSRNRINRIPVVDASNTLVGIITRSDIIRAIAQGSITPELTVAHQPSSP